MGELTPLLAAVAREGRPELGALAALTAGLAAGVVGAATSELGLRAQAAALARRAEMLARLNATHHSAAVEVLAGGPHPDPQGVLRAAGSSPLAIAALAVDVAQLASVVAESEPVSVGADAAGAAELAAGAAGAAEQLVRVNLVLRDDPAVGAAVSARVAAARSAAQQAAAAIA